jgi:hypothetical protein
MLLDEVKVLPEIPQEKIDEAMKMIEGKQSKQYHELMGDPGEMDDFLAKIEKI